MSHPIAPASSGRKPQSRGARPFTHFLLGIVAGTAGSLTAQLLLESLPKRPVVSLETEAEVEDAQGATDEAAASDPEEGKKASSWTVDSTSPWLHFWIGVGFAVPVTVIASWLLVAYPAGEENAWMLVKFWALLVVPGLSLAGLGVYITRQLRRGRVMYKLNRHDYLSMGLQFLPGTAIAVFGNLLPPDFEVLGLSISWVSLILGTAVSVMLVRKFGDPSP